MEFVNGNCIFSKQEYKNLLNVLFDMNKENQMIQDKLEELGFTVSEGDMCNVFYCPSLMLESIIPDAEEKVNTNFFRDFNFTHSFEFFYNKYFEGEF